MKLKKKDITNTINKKNEYIHALFSQKNYDENVAHIFM